MSSENRNLTVSLSSVWFIGWLFTIGYAHLGIGRALLALVIWPYYDGTELSP